MTYTFKKIWNTFTQLDEAAADFRKSVGITRDSSKELETMARGIAIEYMRLGVEAKDVYSSIKDIADALGSTQYASKGLVENMSIFSAQLGISTKTSAQFTKTMAMVGNSTVDAQKNMMYFAQHMSAAAGVPLDAVMDDVAQASQESYQFLSKNPLELVKAAVEAKRMGTSIQSAAKSSSSLLNFTESVKNEMEASVLLGKGINLQKARELAYHRDIRGLNNEILKIAQQTNFENLDPFQQDAVAKALGKSAGEVATMVQSAREHQNLMNHMTDEQRKQYKIYEDALNANDKTKISMEEQAKSQLQSMSNQAAIKSISLAWNGIMAKLGQVVLPKIATVLTFVAKILNSGIVSSVIKWGTYLLLPLVALSTIMKSLSGINTLLTYLGRPVLTLRTPLQLIINMFKFLIEPLKVGAQWIGRMFGGSVGGSMTRMLGWVGRFASGLLEILNPVSKIVAAFSAGWFLGKLLNKFEFIQKATQNFFLTIFNVVDSFKNGIGPGLIGLGINILKIITTPFKLAYTIIISIWKLIPTKFKDIITLSGKIIGPLLLNYFTVPFKIGWSIIKSLFFNGGKFIGFIMSTTFKFISNIFFGIPGMIVNGLLSVGPAIYNALKQPFLKAWDWIKELFLGKSPSQLGLMIVDGIMAVDGMLIKALISPFQVAWNFIKKIPFVSKLFGGTDVSKDMKPEEKAKIAVEKPKPDVDTTKKTAAMADAVGSANDELSKIMSSVLSAISGLRDDLKAGGINANVYLDSQKLDAGIGRRLKLVGSLT